MFRKNSQGALRPRSWCPFFVDVDGGALRLGVAFRIRREVFRRVGVAGCGSGRLGSHALAAARTMRAETVMVTPTAPTGLTGLTGVTGVTTATGMPAAPVTIVITVSGPAMAAASATSIFRIGAGFGAVARVAASLPVRAVAVVSMSVRAMPMVTAVPVIRVGGGVFASAAAVAAPAMSVMPTMPVSAHAAAGPACFVLGLQ